MANAYLSKTLATFEATVQRSKNRLIAVPVKVQRQLGLRRRVNNHIVLYSIRVRQDSIRVREGGRWNHHLAYLTKDNEFAVPSDVTGIEAGFGVEVKIHRVIPDADALARAGERDAAPGALLSELAALGEAVEADDRVDGSERVDEYLNGG